MWEMLTALEKGAVPFESWRGRAEDLDTVIDIASRKNAKPKAPKQESGDEKGFVEESPNE